MTLQSIHVPATTIQRLVRVVTWLGPTTVLGVVMFTYNWFGSRASIGDVGTKIEPAITAAAAAQADAHHAASIADGHTAELAALWGHVIALRAELRVLRAYSKTDAATRGAYVQSAQNFYALRFEEQLKLHANAPAYAAELALRNEWRPDK